MPISSRWVDAIHARLLVRYGTQWTNRYLGIDPELVKADWAVELELISAEGIKHALQHLPIDSPPNAAQFKALCLRHHANTPALPEPDRDPDVGRQALAAIQRPKCGGHCGRQWALDARARIAAGAKMPIAQIRMVDAALRTTSDDEQAPV